MNEPLRSKPTEFMTRFESLSKEERLSLLDYLFGWFCGADDQREDQFSKEFRKAVSTTLKHEAAHV